MGFIKTSKQLDGSTSERTVEVTCGEQKSCNVPCARQRDCHGKAQTKDEFLSSGEFFRVWRGRRENTLEFVTLFRVLII